MMGPSAGERVLMLLENNPFPQDGRVRREAATLVGENYRVTVVCPGAKGQRRCEVVDGVQVYRFPALPPMSGFLGYLCEYGYAMVAMFALSVLALLRGGFDIIHAHNPPDTLALIALCYKLLGKRFVFDHHDLSPELYCARFGGQARPFVYRALIFFERLACRLADCVIATNRSYQALEMTRGGVPEARIVIVRNGPDLNRLRPAEPDPTLREKASTIIAYAGVMGFQDGIDYLLRALHHLAYRLERTDFCCVVVGDGDAAASLKALAAELDLTPYVRFTGWLSGDDYVRCLSTADICVDPDPANPYNDRSTMIKMMEYMALAKPIVAFDLAEHRVTAQDAAVYARPSDEADFAGHIVTLMDDPERRRRMGQFGKARVETELAWAHQEKHLLEAYARLARRRLPARSPHGC